MRARSNFNAGILAERLYDSNGSIRRLIKIFTWQKEKENVMKDRKVAEEMIVKAKKMIVEAEERLKALEVTYSVGDRFTGRDGRKHMIVGAQSSDVLLVSMDEGLGYGTPVKYAGGESCLFLSEATFNQIAPVGLTRYWDNRKGCKV